MSQATNIQKYQYLRPSDNDIRYEPLLKGCCITIATIVNKNDDQYSCDWIITFKNPRDQFSKQIAREMIATADVNDPYTFCGTLYLGKHYKRIEIVAKILSVLYYHEDQLTINYRLFVRRWLMCYMY